LIQSFVVFFVILNLLNINFVTMIILIGLF
jgi:hypothetical protein